MEHLHVVTEQLRSPDEEIRRIAVVSLAGSPLEEVKESLYYAMGDASWRIRKEAVNTLIAVPISADIMEELIAMLRDPDNAGLRNSAVEALERLGVRAVPVLCRHLTDLDHDVRKFIIDILGSIGAAESVPLLIQALDDSDPNVCAAAAENLGKIADERAVAPLLQALEKTDEWLRYTILEALVKIGKEVPMAAIAPLASENLLKKAVFDCLGAVGDSTALPLLVEGLKERVRNAREAAACALMTQRERICGTPAEQKVDSLIRELKGSPFVDGLITSLDTSDRRLQEALIKILGIIGDERATPTLLRGCNDDRLQRCSLQALKTMGEEIVASLSHLFTTADEGDRRLITYVCGELRFANCGSLLREGIRDTDPLVRRLSVVAAGKIGLAVRITDIAELLDDTELEVRAGAIEALTRLAEQGRETVLKIAQELAASNSPEKRRDAAVLFASLHDAEKLSLLIKDEDTRVRKAAVLSLAELKSATSVGHLVMALVDEDADVRIAAANALGDIGGSHVLEPLLLALRDEDPWVQCASLRGLGKLGSEKGVPGIMEALAHTAGPVLIAALEALVDIQGGRSCVVVREALENQDEEVVKAGIEMLSRFGDGWLDDYREKLLAHPHWDVRGSFIKAMAALRGREALSCLQSALETETDELVRNLIIETMDRV